MAVVLQLVKGWGLCMEPQPLLLVCAKCSKATPQHFPSPLAGEAPPLAAGRRRLLVLPLDSDFVLPQATAALRGLLDRLKSSGQREGVGVGLLSMLGFDSSCEHLEVGGVVGLGVKPALHWCLVVVWRSVLCQV